MRSSRVIGLFALALALQGCAAAGVTLAGAGAGVGMGAGVEHTLNGIVFKTFTASANEVRFATLKALDVMGMPITDDQQTPAGWKLTATATDRTIDIELESITNRTTRMRVVASEGGIFFKDASTATEIIAQTAQSLQNDPPAKATGSNRKRSAS
jgi:hypothetical protein